MYYSSLSFAPLPPLPPPTLLLHGILVGLAPKYPAKCPYQNGTNIGT
jgi:hypothetical protein